MERKNKIILILTAQFGSGHTSAANAIKNRLEKKHPEYDIRIRNFVNISMPKMNKTIVAIYEKNTKYTPILYNSYYYIKKSMNTKLDFSYRFCAPKITDYIYKIKPDLIISTFPVACGCVNEFKLKYPQLNIPNITVVTDVVDSKEWIHEQTNMYFVPTKEIKNRYVHYGISPDKIKVTGVPVDENFSIVSEKSKSKYKYRVLIVGGGRGLFDFDEDFFYTLDCLAKQYSDKIKITLITGNNKKLYDNITKKTPLNNIFVLGYVNSMYNLIRNYDIILTKPGGATLFEAINSKTPVILKYPKVGQEIENTKFVVDKGIGAVYKLDKDLEDLFYNLIDGKLDSFIEYIKSNLKCLKSSIHPEEIPEYIDELTQF